jgi:hypothetical protein
MSYRRLSAEEIVSTLRTLEQRIAERFPGSGLSEVCRELIGIAEDTQRKAEAIAAPNRLLRAAIWIAIAVAIAGILFIALTVRLQIGSTEMFGVLQGIDAGLHLLVLLGVTLLFVVSLEDRVKRRRSLRDLHVFRSIAHVIDMHQLTKDPSSILDADRRTKSSPQRTMSRFELARYLDYCSEMLALTSKLAALYAQNLPDPVVIDAVNDIEDLTANLSRKIWQKITIIEADSRGAAHDRTAQREPPLGR